MADRCRCSRAVRRGRINLRSGGRDRWRCRAHPVFQSAGPAASWWRRARSRPAAPRGRGGSGGRRRRVRIPCYAIAPVQIVRAYYRYEFLRPLFPRLSASGGLVRQLYADRTAATDQKHVCVAEAPDAEGRAGLRAVSRGRRQLLNTADIDGCVAARQRAEHHHGDRRRWLAKDFGTTASMSGSCTSTGRCPQDRNERARQDRGRAVSLSVRRQLTRCARQGTDRRNMRGRRSWRVVYRRISSQIPVACINTAAGGGGVRWCGSGCSRMPRRAPAAGHLRARRAVPLDGEPGRPRQRVINHSSAAAGASPASFAARRPLIRRDCR